MTDKAKTISSTIACLLTLVFSACVPTSGLYVGKSVPAEQVVAIPEGSPVHGSVETFDITINYELVRTGDKLRISGQAALPERYQLQYGRVNYLQTYLFCVDEAAHVLKTVALANAMTGSPDERLVFARSFDLPGGTTGLSFGFNGEVEEGGERNTLTHNFYRLPW